MRALSILWLPLLVLATAGCSESDATALRLRLAGDLSGALDASALSLPDEPAPYETASSGVEWGDRARISLGTASFADVRAVELAELRFEAELRSEGLSYVRAYLPRGENVRWYRLLTTTDEERRQRLAEALEADGGAELLGATVKLVIEPPARVISSSAGPSLRGMKNETKKEEASLEIPVEALMAEGEELVWTVIW